MVYYVFTVGIALVGVMPGEGGNAIVSTNALTNYSYVNASEITGVQLARCVTGLGPSGTDDNSVLGGLYFNRDGIPFVSCDDGSSGIVQPIAASNFAGVINIIQCKTFSVTVEGLYTCIVISSSMIYESIRFGVYFTGRSELHNFLFN